jgi:hypothetical protein
MRTEKVEIINFKLAMCTKFIYDFFSDPGLLAQTTYLKAIYLEKKFNTTYMTQFF